MESNFNNDNFERLLRESSDQYRMYPSESVWKNVYNSLHTRRRWLGIGFILFLSAGFVTAIMMTNAGSGRSVASTTKSNSPLIREPAGTAVNRDIDLLLPKADKGTALTDQEVISFYQSEPLTADNRNNQLLGTTTGDAVFAPVRTVVITSPISEISISETELAENSLPVVIPDTDGPLNLVIEDAVTDQDSWILRNGKLPGVAVTPARSQYKIQRAFSPLTIESVINSYRRRNNKLSFQFYFTPTISYRKLSENKSSLQSGSAGSAPYNNINNVVTHKPDMGLEVGIAGRYAINKKIKLRAGLQFNTSRYDIKAFSYAREVTTIALNTGSYTADSVNTISSYRNFNGYKSDWLHNFYFQISAPVGIEVKLAGDDKIQFGVGSSIQPTYVLGDRAYLLSSNYKNYAEVPSLMRRWNVNASFEAFVSYSTGKMNWQVGPQIRYQLHSSFVKEYPVKENLFDFGLKIGVSANR